MHEFKNEQFTKMVKMEQRGSELFISQARRQVSISTKTQTDIQTHGNRLSSTYAILNSTNYPQLLV